MPGVFSRMHLRKNLARPGIRAQAGLRAENCRSEKTRAAKSPGPVPIPDPSYFNSQAGVQKSNPPGGRVAISGDFRKCPPRFSKLTPPFWQVLETIILFLNRKKFREIAKIDNFKI